MQIMQTYSDLLAEIDLVKEQIDYTKHEIEYWLGVDVDKGKGIPFAGIGDHKFGMNAAIIQSEKKLSSYYKLRDRLKELEYAKVRMDISLEKLDGLEYQIAYKRIVEWKTHQEIADDLGYTNQHIRRLWSDIKKQQKCNRQSDITVI